jgi:hypothetical protein
MLRRRAVALGLISALSWTGAGFAQEPAKPAPMGQPAIIKGEGIVHDMGPCCAPCEPTCGGLQAGIGFYYIKPVWDNNPALLTTTFDGQFSRGRLDHFSYDFDFAPRVWIGISDGNAGARVRFWTYDNSASLSRIDDDAGGAATSFISSAAPLGVSVTTTGIGQAPQSISAVGDLQLEVWDLEGTYTHQVCGFDITYFGGLRYVHMSQSYNAAVVNINDGVILQALSSGHNLNVAGLTGGVETRRALGCTGLAVYGSSRASLLYGHSRQTAVAINSVLETSSEGADTSREDFLPILEAELGVEYSTCMGNSTLFIQAGLVGQVWFGAGNNSRSSTPDVLGPVGGGTVSDDNLGFFGISIAGGIRY